MTQKLKLGVVRGEGRTKWLCPVCAHQYGGSDGLAIEVMPVEHTRDGEERRGEPILVCARCWANNRYTIVD